MRDPQFVRRGWAAAVKPDGFASLRELVLHYAAGRGWRTQRQIAVFCGLDESALSRLLNGEQDVGALRTHALFQAVGIPVERYDLAYALLGQAQAAARSTRTLRRAHPARAANGREELRPVPPARPSLTRSALATAVGPARWFEPPDVPVALVVAHFAMRRFTGQQIAAFFAGAADWQADDG